MKKILIVLSITALWSCSPARYCADHYPAVSSDSIVTNTVECWDTLKMPIPFKIVLHDTAFVPGLMSPDLSYHQEENLDGIKAVVDIKNGRLTFETERDSLYKELAVLKKTTITKDHTTKVLPPVQVFIEHWYLKFLIVQFFIFLLAIIFFIAWKYLKLTAKI